MNKNPHIAFTFDLMFVPHDRFSLCFDELRSDDPVVRSAM